MKTVEVFCVKVLFLLLVRKGLMKQEQVDEIMKKLSYGMTFEKVYETIDEMTREES